MLNIHFFCLNIHFFKKFFFQLSVVFFLRGVMKRSEQKRLNLGIFDSHSKSTIGVSTVFVENE